MRFVFFVIVALLAFMMSIQIRRRGISPQLAALGIGPGALQLIALASAALAAFQTVTIVDAGTVGVVKIFGEVQERPLTEGINFRNPFAEIIEMNIKIQERREEMRVPSKEGLTVGLEASVLFRLDPSQAPKVFKTIGREDDYIRKILAPNFRSVVRGVTAQYEAKALYTDMREEVAMNIQNNLHAATSLYGILIESTPLRQVELPSDLSQAIEEKLRAEQESQRMEFILAKEKKEADRKRIEASGIRDFNKTVAEGISDNFLRWKGIEATEKLASSTNAKVVVIGSGKDGLPIILGGQ